MADNVEKAGEILNDSPADEPEKIFDAIIATNKPSNLTQSQDPEKMEVHHHPELHHKPKPWKEYLLEGLMIFLAVTLGFFAENFREYRAERENEKHTIESLLLCLASDTIQLENIIDENRKIINHLDNFNKLKNTDISKEDAKRKFLSESINGLTSDPFFKTNDGALEQLKSSGMFRLVHKQRIIDSILKYDLKNKSTVYQEADYYYIFKEALTSIRLVIDLSILRDTAYLKYHFTNTGMGFEFKNINDIAINTDKEKINNLHSIAAILAAAIDSYVGHLKDQLAYGKGLINFLKKEYDIEL
ncbi:MAG TPA: hypothetical protein VNV85_08810 [Puia sp.]|jgi:hypothetical protein|nr:hypothetical protein [Puia sp.]